MKTSLIAATAALLLAVPALADDDLAKPTVTPSAPTAITQALADGSGTIAGTIVEADGRGFTVADASGQVRVQARHAQVQAGDPVTVTGRADDGRMKAHQVIRGDGSTVLPGRHRHGQDHD